MTPAEVLLEQLAIARRAGESFDAAWPLALEAALRVARRDERSDWADVLTDLAESWRSAFERRAAARRELAIAALAADDEREPLPERECVRCSRAIPDERGRKGAPARYCSEKCRRQATQERRLVAA